MKKIAVVAVVVGLSIVVWIQAMKLRSLHPSEDFEYAFRQDIDSDYHDQVALKDYFATAYEVGSFAREMWKSAGINVRFPDRDDAASKSAVRHYNSLKAYCDSLGVHLAHSKALKEKGFHNADVKGIEMGSVTVQDLRLLQSFGVTTLQKGDRNDGVKVLQSLLIAKGYQIPHDSYFWDETETAVRDYQTKLEKKATGIADAATLNALLEPASSPSH